MVGVRKKEKETSGALARRFSRKVQQSGILLSARANLYRARKKSKLKKRSDALKRLGRRKQYVKMRKLGRVK